MEVPVGCPLAVSVAVAIGCTYLKISVRYRRVSRRSRLELPVLRFSGWKLVWCGRTLRSLLVVLLANVAAGLLWTGRFVHRFGMGVVAVEQGRLPGMGEPLFLDRAAEAGRCRHAKNRTWRAPSAARGTGGLVRGGPGSCPSGEVA